MNLVLIENENDLRVSKDFRRNNLQPIVGIYD